MQIFLARSMKILSCIIIMIDTIYMASSSFFDKFLKHNVPKFYENLNFLGVKATDFKGLFVKNLTNHEIMMR